MAVQRVHKMLAKLQDENGDLVVHMGHDDEQLCGVVGDDSEEEEDEVEEDGAAGKRGPRVTIALHEEEEEAGEDEEEEAGEDEEDEEEVVLEASEDDDDDDDDEIQLPPRRRPFHSGHAPPLLALPPAAAAKRGTVRVEELPAAGAEERSRSPPHIMSIVKLPKRQRWIDYKIEQLEDKLTKLQDSVMSELEELKRARRESVRYAAALPPQPQPQQPPPQQGLVADLAAVLASHLPPGPPAQPRPYPAGSYSGLPPWPTLPPAAGRNLWGGGLY